SLYQRHSLAKHSIYFSRYICQADEAGTGIAKLLMRKARAGLDVKLYLDAWGSIYFSADLEKELKESGVQFVYFRPFEILRPYRHLLRNHRRIIIVDHESALTGGFAIQDAWADFYPDNEVADIQVWLKGPIVQEMESLFLEDWQDATGEPVTMALADTRQTGPPTESVPESCDPVVRACTALSSLIVSGPDHPGNLQRFYAQMIALSETRVWIATPYFVPDETLILALENAANRGVDVRLIVASAERIEEFPVTYVRNPYLQRILEAGGKVYSFDRSFLHSKSALFDDSISIVGTSNLDRRSLEINHEVDVAFYDRPLNARLAVLFLEYIAQSTEITLEEMQQRSCLTRIQECIWSPLTPQL
ncbi:MAG: hypothetical protein KDK33_16065, partial [Leptospiraceae bacterium]|nr:hypothetical protein [Leptospiraceae bacterium]